MKNSIMIIMSGAMLWNVIAQSLQQSGPFSNTQYPHTINSSIMLFVLCWLIKKYITALAQSSRDNLTDDQITEYILFTELQQQVGWLQNNAFNTCHIHQCQKFIIAHRKAVCQSGNHTRSLAQYSCIGKQILILAIQSIFTYSHSPNQKSTGERIPSTMAEQLHCSPLVGVALYHQASMKSSTALPQC